MILCLAYPAQRNIHSENEDGSVFGLFYRKVSPNQIERIILCLVYPVEKGYSLVEKMILRMGGSEENICPSRESDSTGNIYSIT